MMYCIYTAVYALTQWRGEEGGEGRRRPREALCRVRYLTGENLEYRRLHCNVLAQVQQFWHLQLNMVIRMHRFIVHFSGSVIDVGLNVRMDVAGWRGAAGTTDRCPAQEKPSRSHW